MNDRLVWIDCEMTGLDLRRDALIEIAALVTDGELRVLGEGVDLVIHADESLLAGMPDVVRDMHARSGLTEEVRRATVTLREAEEQVLAYVREHVPDPRTAPLAGNSIATDRGFLARDMPELDAHLHYRMVDVSSIKELCRRWFPRVFYAKPEKGMAHRALADIRESIRELDYYRKHPVRPPARPDQRGGPGGGRLPDPARELSGEHRVLLTSSPAPVGDAMVGVAQLVEHLVVVQEVAGSSPVTHPAGPAAWYERNSW